MSIRLPINPPVPLDGGVLVVEQLVVWVDADDIEVGDPHAATATRIDSVLSTGAVVSDLPLLVP